ncbi:hypothetical protein [Rothia nasisuis]|uniref:hypothetical protein n=1 Tax=Rothia nasisuis TaxID=2109647 RepID=UPI001F1DB98D|nr:hypothetical protein [Rothia nasisuis]
MEFKASPHFICLSGLLEGGLRPPTCVGQFLMEGPHNLMDGHIPEAARVPQMPTGSNGGLIFIEQGMVCDFW